MLDRSEQIIDNRYRLIRLLAKGGQGDVYLAEDISSPKNEPVAVKLLHTDGINIESFINEARATIALLPHCPHILRIKDFGVDNGTPFLVTDYMSNGSLLQRHPKDQGVALESIISYVKQISKALQCLHKRGLVHRDVSPDNMMIDTNDQILLSDFGIVIPSYSKNRTMFQEAAGKLQYIAPEQIQGHASSASDQYSLGITVYGWLTGRPPFQGNEGEVISQHLSAHPQSLREKIPTLSRDIEEVVLKALNKEPSERFETVTDFAEALERASGFASELSELLEDQFGNKLPSNIQSSSLATSLRHDPLACRGHIGGVRTLSWSFDGKYIASAGSDENICIWETIRGESHLTYDCSHTGDIWAVAWSPDNNYLASGGEDGTVQIREIVTGRTIFTHRNLFSSIHAVAWSPDSSYIAIAGDHGDVQIWDIFRGKLFLTYDLHENSVEALDWSSDGKYIASAGSYDTTVQVWRTDTGEQVQIYNKHRERITSVVWSPDGKHLASASVDKKVRVWEAVTGSDLSIYTDHSDIVKSVTWSPDGRHVASGGRDKTVQVWDVISGRRLYTYDKHTSWVNVVKWSPKGQYLASGSWDQTVQVWREP